MKLFLKKYPQTGTSIYGKGTKVLVVLSDTYIWKIKDVPTWDGLTWMYTFEGTDLRCGERYLRPCDQEAPTGKIKSA